MKNKYYVVWKGRKTGIFHSWAECNAQVNGFEGAKYKGFSNLEGAKAALKDEWHAHYNKKSDTVIPKKSKPHVGHPLKNSICVDAAWNSVTKDMEYRGIDYMTGEEIFRKGPYPDGTNNIGEYLAIVHALALLKKNGINRPVYSDSRNAIQWVIAKKHRSNLKPTAKNKTLFELLDRADTWLEENTYPNKLLKWETSEWGENPADFGRK